MQYKEHILINSLSTTYILRSVCLINSLKKLLCHKQSECRELKPFELRSLVIQ